MEIDIDLLMKNDTEHAELYKEIDEMARKIAKTRTITVLSECIVEQKREEVEKRWGKGTFKVEEFNDNLKEMFAELVRNGDYESLYNQIYTEQFIELLKTRLMENVNTCETNTWKQISNWIVENGNTKLPDQKMINKINQNVIHGQKFKDTIGAIALGTMIGTAAVAGVNSRSGYEEIKKGYEEAQEEVAGRQKAKREEKFSIIFNEKDGVNLSELEVYVKEMIINQYNEKNETNLTPEDVKFYKNYDYSVTEDRAEDGSKILRENHDEQKNNENGYTIKLYNGYIITLYVDGNEISVHKDKDDNITEVYEPDQIVKTAGDNILTDNGLAYVVDAALSIMDFRGFQKEMVSDYKEAFKEEVAKYDAKLLENAEITIDTKGLGLEKYSNVENIESLDTLDSYITEEER